MQVAHHACGMLVCAGDVNLLTQGRLSSHQGTSHAGISNMANSRHQGRGFGQLVPHHWSVAGPDEHPMGAANGRRLKQCSISPFQQPVHIAMYFMFQLHGRSLSLRSQPGLVLWSGSSHDCSTYLRWWHSGGGGRGRALALDSNVPCRTTVAVFGDLLMFKTTHITAEPKKDLTELLHMLKQSVGSLEMYQTIKELKKGCCAVQK